jgi:S1-C subfamily serine protease
VQHQPVARGGAHPGAGGCRVGRLSGRDPARLAGDGRDRDREPVLAAVHGRGGQAAVAAVDGGAVPISSRRVLVPQLRQPPLGRGVEGHDRVVTVEGEHADGAGRHVSEVSANDVLDVFEAPPPEVLPERFDPATSGGGGDQLPTLRGADLADPTAPVVVRPQRLRQRYQRRRLGVAPFVRPSARRSRRKRRRDYRQLGFVELTPEKLRLRHRVLPRTVIGISTLVLALGIGVGVAGASLYAYYDWRSTQTENKTKQFADEFPKVFAQATEQLQLTRNQAIDQINGSLTPLKEFIEDSNAVKTLPSRVGPGVWFVRTLDPSGKPSVGSSFVVQSDDQGSLLLTSYEVVQAAAAKPAPPLTLEKNGESIPAELWAWDADHDLALLKTPRAGLPQLEWAPEPVRSKVAGTRLYALSGSGGQGATASPGLAIDENQSGVRHNAPLSPEFRGGPLVNSGGQVIAVVSTAYRPTGIDAGEIPYAPSILAACEKVLRCPSAVTATTAPPSAPPASTGG